MVETRLTGSLGEDAQHVGTALTSRKDGYGYGDGYGNGDGDGVKIRRYNPEDFRAICNEQFLKLIPPKKGK